MPTQIPTSFFTHKDVAKLVALAIGALSILFLALVVTGGIGWAQTTNVIRLAQDSAGVPKTTAGKADKFPTVTCPDNKPCKIIAVTDEEEKALAGPNMIFETAYMGRPLDLGNAVAYFRKKLAETPITQPEPAKK